VDEFCCIHFVFNKAVFQSKIGKDLPFIQVMTKFDGKIRPGQFKRQGFNFFIGLGYGRQIRCQRILRMSFCIGKRSS